MGIWNGIDAVSNLVGSQKVIRMFIKFSSLFLDIDTGNRKIGIQTITSTETSTASPGTTAISRNANVHTLVNINKIIIVCE